MKLNARKKPSTLSKKVVLVGDSFCGKTCLLSSFSQQSWSTAVKGIYKPTVFETPIDVNVPDSKYSLSIHDTAGNDSYDRLRPLSYPEADVAVLCFALDCPDSFQNACDKWLLEIKHFCPNVPFILVGTKSDLAADTRTVERLRKVKQHPVTRTQARETAKRIKAKGYVECSAVSNNDIDLVFVEALKATLQTTTKEKALKRLKIVFKFLKRHIGIHRFKLSKFTETTEHQIFLLKSENL